MYFFEALISFLFQFCISSGLLSFTSSKFLSFQGIARRLVEAALSIASRKRDMQYDNLKTIEKGTRRFFHDDITVVVIFIDHQLLENSNSVPEVSIRGFIDTVGPSNFNIQQGVDANARSIN